MSRLVEVVDYDPQWPQMFAQLRAYIWPVLSAYVLAIEHVGSTSVEGLAAKPIIDMDAVVRPEDLPRAIEGLATLGYVHRGNLGIEGREAFSAPSNLPRHNLYVCLQGSLGLRNHLALRDYLRTNPEAVKQYSALKRELALAHSHDIEAYIEGKTQFIVEILQQMGLGDSELSKIEISNRKT